MKKIWCPYISCSGCTVANDIDFKFCKACGLSRLDKDRNQQEKNENKGTITQINDRIKSLDALLNSASYSKQKCNLKKEVDNFLVLLDPLKNFSNATPDDIRKFLIFKEKMVKRNYMMTNVSSEQIMVYKAVIVRERWRSNQLILCWGKLERFSETRGVPGTGTPCS